MVESIVLDTVGVLSNLPPSQTFLGRLGVSVKLLQISYFTPATYSRFRTAYTERPTKVW